MGNNRNHLTSLRNWLVAVEQRSTSVWKHCWHASVDGWASSTFHSRCDGKGPTVTIIRVGRYIFGGYTSLSWGTLVMKSEITLPQFLLTFAWGLESTENGQKFLEQIWKNHNVSNFFDSSPPYKQRQTPVYIRNFSRISTFISLWERGRTVRYFPKGSTVLRAQEITDIYEWFHHCPTELCLGLEYKEYHRAQRSYLWWQAKRKFYRTDRTSRLCLLTGLLCNRLSNRHAILLQTW